MEQIPSVCFNNKHQFIIKSAFPIPFHMKLDRILQSHNIFLYERKDDEQQIFVLKSKEILISVHINTRTTCVDKIPYS